MFSAITASQSKPYQVLLHIGVILSLSLLLIATSGCKTIKTTQDPLRTADNHLARAKVLIEEGDFENAYLHLNQALALSPQDPAVYRNLGWLYIYTSQADKAKSELEKVLALEPNSPETNYLAGGIFAKLDQHKKALSYYEKALSEADNVTPKWEPSAVFYFDEAQSYMALDRNDDAIKKLTYGISLLGDKDSRSKVNFYYTICTAFYRENEVEQAKHYCGRAAGASNNEEEKGLIEEFVHTMELAAELENTTLEASDLEETDESDKDAPQDSSTKS